MAHESEGHWFEPVADHLGSAYLRYSFTKGTKREVDAIEALAGLDPGSRLLDVGCGPGRHALEFARRGYEVVGVDVSSTFIDLATEAAEAAGLANVSFSCVDARELGADAEFDLVISLCQGAFGLTGGPSAPTAPVDGVVPLELDEPLLSRFAQAVRPGGLVVVSAFSAYFQLRFAGEDNTFDATAGVNHERTTVLNPDGEPMDTDLWTTCYTPRELRLLARQVGLSPEAIHGVEPGQYGWGEPNTDCPEFLLVARRPLS